MATCRPSNASASPSIAAATCSRWDPDLDDQTTSDTELPDAHAAAATAAAATAAAAATSSSSPSLTLGGMRDQIADMERATIAAILESCHGSQTEAAKQLGISRRTLIYRMEKHGLKPPGARKADRASLP